MKQIHYEVVVNYVESKETTVTHFYSRNDGGQAIEYAKGLSKQHVSEGIRSFIVVNQLRRTLISKHYGKQPPYK